MLCALAGLSALELRVGAFGAISGDQYFGSYLGERQSDLISIYGSAASNLTPSPGLGFRAGLDYEALINRYLGFDAELSLAYYGGGLVSSPIALWESGTTVGLNLMGRGFLPLTSNVSLNGGLGGGVAFFPFGLSELASAYGVTSITTLSASVFASAIADVGCDFQLNIPHFIPLTVRTAARCEYATSFLKANTYGNLSPLTASLNLCIWYTIPSEVKK
jgi:hypothetical protein